MENTCGDGGGERCMVNGLSFGQTRKMGSGTNGSREVKKKTLNLRLIGQEGHVDLLQCLHELGDSGFPDLSKEAIRTIYAARKRKPFRNLAILNLKDVEDINSSYCR